MSPDPFGPRSRVSRARYVIGFKSQTLSASPHIRPFAKMFRFNMIAQQSGGVHFDQLANTFYSYN